MKRYLSASLKIGERRHPAGCVRHLAGHANLWLILATTWLIPLAHGQAAQPNTPASQIPTKSWCSASLPTSPAATPAPSPSRM